MRVVMQRVSRASVRVNGEFVGSIEGGAMVLVGAGQGDGEAEVEYMVGKVLGLRIFGDEEGKMNLSIEQAGGALLVVSQFTLYGDVRRGRRPSFVRALEPVEAERLVDLFVERVRAGGVRVETGVFGAEMEVELVNAGPVTLMFDSEKTI